MYIDGNLVSLLTEELTALVQGKYNTVTCHQCNGKGWVWVDGIAGMEVAFVDPSRDPDDFYMHYCTECSELGYFIVFRG